MLRDAEYFKTRIGSLDGAKDTADDILNIIKEKPIPKAKAPAPPPPPPPTNGTDTEVKVETETVAEEEKGKEGEMA